MFSQEETPTHKDTLIHEVVINKEIIIDNEVNYDRDNTNEDVLEFVDILVNYNEQPSHDHEVNAPIG